jgi:hypothetical protein
LPEAEVEGAERGDVEDVDGHAMIFSCWP